MPRSQNGFSANNRALISSYTVKGTSVRLPIRRGSVATVLLYVAQRFHREVEPLRQGWCWGYAERLVRGGVSLSNHASGTAIDLNAPFHPLGLYNTFSGAQQRSIRRILASTKVNGRQVVRWGGDYQGRKDDMHFEIVGSASDVDALARRIRSASTLPAKTIKRVLRIGMRGSDVKLLQQKLNKVMPGLVKGYASLTADGDYGVKTANAVYAFKRAKSFRGMLPNKEAGSGTVKALGLKWTGR